MPSSTGTCDQCTRAATPDPSSISCRWPAKPNPVTSVAACTCTFAMASAPFLLSSIIISMAGRSCSLEIAPARRADVAMPVPSFFV